MVLTGPARHYQALGAGSGRGRQTRTPERRHTATRAGGSAGPRVRSKLFPVAREYPTVLELVGVTPIVRLDRISADVAATILGKLEFLNPGGSVKTASGYR